MVGPDGVIYEPEDKDKKPSQGGKTGGGDGARDGRRPGRSGRPGPGG